MTLTDEKTGGGLLSPEEDLQPDRFGSGVQSVLQSRPTAEELGKLVCSDTIVVVSEWLETRI